MKCKESHPGFEFMSPCTFPTTVIITPRFLYINMYVTHNPGKKLLVLIYNSKFVCGRKYFSIGFGENHSWKYVNKLFSWLISFAWIQTSCIPLKNVDLVSHPFHSDRLVHWGYRILQLHLWKPVRPPPTTNDFTWNDTKLHLIIRVRSRNFGKSQAPLHCHYS